MNDASHQTTFSNGITPAVVHAARERRPEAFETIYRVLGASVYGFVLNHTRNPSWADDVTAETFLEVVRSIRRFEGTPEGLRAWIFRIARNTLIDHIRREQRRSHDPLEHASAQADPAPDPETQAISATERERVARYVDDLPPDQREVVLLRLVADLPISEVASMTGRTEGAVKSLQHRALQGLARRMHRAGDLPEDG